MRALAHSLVKGNFNLLHVKEEKQIIEYTRTQNNAWLLSIQFPSQPFVLASHAMLPPPITNANHYFNVLVNPQSRLGSNNSDKVAPKLADWTNENVWPQRW